MLEILLIVGACKMIGTMLRAKSRSPLLFQIMFVVGWVGGEICGFIAGAIMSPEEELGLTGYVFALVGAAVGGGTVLLAAYLMPSAANPYENQTMQPVAGASHLPPPPTDFKNPYDPPRQ